MFSTTSIARIRTSAYGRKVNDWIKTSYAKFEDYVTKSSLGAHDDKVWVIKYFWTGHLTGFFNNNNQLQISDTAGHTWGRGLYIAPLSLPRSTLMYGRAGIMGYIPAASLRTFDATQQTGKDLFIEWAQTYDSQNYQKALTEVYPETFLHEIKSNFRQVMDIDLVFFNPDQQNISYVKPDDVWFLLSDFSSTNSYSDRIKDCKWVLVVGEEFVQDEHDKREYHTHMLDHRKQKHPNLKWGPEISDSDIRQRIDNAYHTSSLILLEP